MRKKKNWKYSRSYLQEIKRERIQQGIKIKKKRNKPRLQRKKRTPEWQKIKRQVRQLFGQAGTRTHKREIQRIKRQKTGRVSGEWLKPRRRQALRDTRTKYKKLEAKTSGQIKRAWQEATGEARRTILHVRRINEKNKEWPRNQADVDGKTHIHKGEEAWRQKVPGGIIIAYQCAICKRPLVRQITHGKINLALTKRRTYDHNALKKKEEEV